MQVLDATGAEQTEQTEQTEQSKRVGARGLAQTLGTWQKRSAAITAATGATQLRTSAKRNRVQPMRGRAVSIRMIDIVDRRRAGCNAGSLRVQKSIVTSSPWGDGLQAVGAGSVLLVVALLCTTLSRSGAVGARWQTACCWLNEAQNRRRRGLCSW